MGNFSVALKLFYFYGRSSLIRHTKKAMNVTTTDAMDGRRLFLQELQQSVWIFLFVLGQQSPQNGPVGIYGPGNCGRGVTNEIRAC